jgi:hypothetical protein
MRKRIWITISKRMDDSSLLTKILTIEDEDDNKENPVVRMAIPDEAYRLLIQIFDIDEAKMTVSIEENLESRHYIMFVEHVMAFEQL